MVEGGVRQVCLLEIQAGQIFIDECCVIYQYANPRLHGLGLRYASFYGALE